jgi:hypothetical protein
LRGCFFLLFRSTLVVKIKKMQESTPRFLKRITADVAHPAAPPAAPAPDPSFKHLCDSNKILFDNEMSQLNDIVKQFNQTLATCKHKYLEFQAKCKSDSESTKPLFDKNNKKFEAYLTNKFVEITRKLTDDVKRTAKDTFSKVSNLQNAAKQNTYIQSLVKTIQTITTEISRLKKADANYSKIVTDITNTIVLMEAEIQNAKTAADTAAVAKKAAEDLADQVREGVKAAKTAAAAKAQADRLTQQKTQLEGEVTKVTDDIQKCEDSWTSLQASASMTGLAKQVADSEAIFAKIQKHVEDVQRLYGIEMEKVKNCAQNKLPADWINRFRPVLETLINNSVTLHNDIKHAMSKIQSIPGDITRNSTEIDTLFQTISQNIADALANVQNTSLLTQANADKSLAESNLKKVEENMKLINTLLASMIPNVEVLNRQAVPLETSLKNVLIKVKEVFKASQDAVAAIGPASTVVPPTSTVVPPPPTAAAAAAAALAAGGTPASLPGGAVAGAGVDGGISTLPASVVVTPLPGDGGTGGAGGAGGDGGAGGAGGISTLPASAVVPPLPGGAVAGAGGAAGISTLPASAVVAPPPGAGGTGGAGGVGGAAAAAAAATALAVLTLSLAQARERARARAATAAAAMAARAYGKRVYPIRNGVLTYYVSL